MHPNPRRIIFVLLILALAATATWYFTREPTAQTNGALAASGSIEAVQVRLAPELGGRVASVHVEEGTVVKAGDVLVEIDPTLLQAQRNQAVAARQVAESGVSAAQSAYTSAQARLASAQAGVKAAQAALDLLQAGPTVEQVQAAEQQLAQAQANLQAVNATLQSVTSGARPEDLAAARLTLEQAYAKYAEMRVVLSQDTLDLIQDALELAETHHQQARERYDMLVEFNLAPPGALDAVRATITDTLGVLTIMQQFSQTVQADTAYYLEIQTAKAAWTMTQDYQNRALARLDYVLALDGIPLQAINAVDDAKDESNRMAEAARQAYTALAFGSLAERLDAAWDDVRSAQRVLNNFGRLPFGSTTSLETLMNQVAAAEALHAVAQANLQAVRNGARPEQLQAAQAQVDSANAQLESAQAGVDAAQAQLDAAQAQVEAAQAVLDTLDVQLAKLSLIAPIDGVVLTRAVEPGEMALPGTTLLVLGQLDRLTITVYLPEDRYGAVELGQSALVSVDSFPDMTFEATIAHIADRAEFTPRNVQTEEGRRTTVFAVKLAVKNPSGKLKPGMPADVEFGK